MVLEPSAPDSKMPSMPSSARSSADEAVYERAHKQRATRRKALLKRVPLAPAIETYDSIIASLGAEGSSSPHTDGLAYITGAFLGTYSTVLGQIAASGKVGIKAQNSVKRIAGTNFQGLCEHALSTWLDTTDLPVCIAPNAPKAMREELTIHGIDHGVDFSVQPDIDMCLWVPDESLVSPIIFLSAKSSLVDRAGQAARWKMYLDMHQTTCTYIPLVADCPVRRTQVRMKAQRRITHCIVTANIYKIDTTMPEDELGTGQCRNNTFMFEHRYTTRNDSREYRPPGWESLSCFPQLIHETFGRTNKRRPRRPPSRVLVGQP